MDNHEEDEDYDIEYLDFHKDDATDYFATVLMEQFPTIKLKPMDVPEWRGGWSISIPPQYEERSLLEVRLVELRDRMYWEKDVLVAYIIESETELEPEDSLH